MLECILRFYTVNPVSAIAVSPFLFDSKQTRKYEEELNIKPYPADNDYCRF